MYNRNNTKVRLKVKNYTINQLSVLHENKFEYLEESTHVFI